MNWKVAFMPLRRLKRSIRLVQTAFRGLQVHQRMAKLGSASIPSDALKQLRLLLSNAITAEDYYELGLHDVNKLATARAFLGSNESSWYFDYLNPRVFDILARDKALFHHLASSLSIPVPETLATIGAAGRPHVGQCFDERSEVEAFLSEQEDIFLKPADGHFGEGALSLGRRSQQSLEWQVLPTGSTITMDSLISHMQSNGSLRRFLVQRRLKPHPVLAEIVPDVCPTIRLVTLFHKGRAEFLGAALRLGNGTSPTDNLTGGGLAVKIDYESGCLGDSYIIQNGLPVRLQKHPFTSRQIHDVRLPNWSDIMALSIQSAEKLSFIPLIGWDIGVTDKGPIVVEINTHPGLRTIQLTQGRGLIDSRLKAALLPHDGLLGTGLNLRNFQPE